MRSPPSPAEPTPELQPVDVRYEHTQGLPALLEHLELSVLLSTYQGELRLGFSRFNKDVGLCRSTSGIARRDLCGRSGSNDVLLRVSGSQ